MDLSYTQNLEDYHLSLAFAGQPTGFYIDVGGGHPIADNVSMWFYERGWSGLVVEPQAPLAALYPRLRPRDIVFCGLVGREAGDVDFHVFDKLHGLSTTVQRHADGAKVWNAEYRTERRPIVNLAELCARHGTGEIDFLKIDVEGAEADVLAGNDWQRYRPKVVVAEAVAPLTGEPSFAAWEPYLLAQGYRFRLDDTLNRFYVADEHPDVFARLPSQRAPWDSARHMYEIGRAPENAAHPDHALAKELARGLWASLPLLEREQIATLLARARRLPEEQIAALAASLDTDAARASLGRIACGYDGGQIVDE